MQWEILLAYALKIYHGGKLIRSVFAGQELSIKFKKKLIATLEIVDYAQPSPIKLKPTFADFVLEDPLVFREWAAITVHHFLTLLGLP